MNKEYIVNNIFKEDGITFNDLIDDILETFLDKELNLFENNNLMN